jgi:hypothetical protein
MGKIDDELAASFREHLLKLGFNVARRLSSDMAFGNELVEYQSTSMRLRIVRDRGQYIFEVAPLREDDWRSLGFVLQFLDGSRDEAYYGIDPQRLSSGFIGHFKEIEALVKQGFLESGYSAFEDAVSKARFRRDF